MTSPSHLQRGSVPLGRGDLTGMRAQLAREEAKDRQETIDRSVRTMTDPSVELEIIQVAGGSDFALPKYVLRAIRAAR